MVGRAGTLVGVGVGRGRVEGTIRVCPTPRLDEGLILFCEARLELLTPQRRAMLVTVSPGRAVTA